MCAVWRLSLIHISILNEGVDDQAILLPQRALLRDAKGNPCLLYTSMRIWENVAVQFGFDAVVQRQGAGSMFLIQ